MGMLSQDVSDEALEWVKSHRKEIIRAFADASRHVSDAVRVAVLMAGSPGAGKTEVSRAFIKRLGESEGRVAVRIDADEVRGLIPAYDGTNSDLVQKAATQGVYYLVNHVLKKKLNFVLDGTLGNEDRVRENIKRALKRDYHVEIIYVYQAPLRAWELVKARQATEGRSIPREAFLEQYFAARKNANMMKREFGERIKLNLVLKDFSSGLDKVWFNVSTIDTHVPENYTRGGLERRLS